MALTMRMEILNDIVYRLGTVPAIVTAASRRDTNNNPFAPSECPAVNVMFGNDTIDELLSQDDHHLQLKIEIFASSLAGATTAEDIFADLTDVISANPNWGGYADGTGSPAPDTSDIYEVGDTISTGTLSFIVHYTTPKGRI